MKIDDLVGAIELDGHLNDDGNIEGRGEYFIEFTKAEAIKIIEHLQKVFELDK